MMCRYANKQKGRIGIGTLAYWHTIQLWNSNQFYYRALKLKDRLSLPARVAQKQKNK